MIGKVTRVEEEIDELVLTSSHQTLEWFRFGIHFDPHVQSVQEITFFILIPVPGKQSQENRRKDVLLLFCFGLASRSRDKTCQQNRLL